jgi:hypothetical protein
MAAPSNPEPTAEWKAQYLVLQQEADFALWRAHEGNAEIKKAYALHLQGQGPCPGDNRLAEVAALERDAEGKYKALRHFLRERFA